MGYYSINGLNDLIDSIKRIRFLGIALAINKKLVKNENREEMDIPSGSRLYSEDLKFSNFFFY